MNKSALKITVIAAGQLSVTASLSHLSEGSGFSILMWGEMQQNDIKLFTSKERVNGFLRSIRCVKGEEADKAWQNCIAGTEIEIST